MAGLATPVLEDPFPFPKTPLVTGYFDHTRSDGIGLIQASQASSIEDQSDDQNEDF